MDETLYLELCEQVMQYARMNHDNFIDEAYDYFWEEDDPTEMIGGIALELGFMNFEDWFICDYAPKEGTPIIDRFIEDFKPDEKSLAMLKAMRDSGLRLYETANVGGKMVFKDVLLGGEYAPTNSALPPLNEGDVFAARLIGSGQDKMMSRAIYLFTKDLKDKVIELVNSQHKRYQRKSAGASMQEFLDSETYLFNMIWASLIEIPKKDQ